MITLTRFLDNPFDNRQISLDELLAFSTDNLQRMVAHNPGGIYTARITGTASALNVMAVCSSDDQVKLGLRKARKQAKDTFRSGLSASIEKIQAVVVAKFGGSGPEVVECFPQGRTVFSDCRDDQLVNHLDALHTALLARQAALGAPVVTDSVALQTTWGALYTASEASTGNKAHTAAEKLTARENLQLQLFFNLLEIAKNNPRQPAHLDLYMQQHLLENPASPPPAPPV